jgi:hypothetical protein
LKLKDMKILIIHQKDNGSWGQDTYAITEMTGEGLQIVGAE